ncbi:hypothetical protein JRC04_11575 [Mycolicibacterium sp. S2-37]|uniref:MmpS family transport accessory protein n=1 Tax=Mycolicibacterium sp. S2-37 TaxID=2810297 RepID=UPI001A946AC8|nr:MmpS family transport accessory protein [Mycolicibacterium sp. S2-37]MBO0678104.1 hypothetical protein [Mycolicibacterium sp. S2-37]
MTDSPRRDGPDPNQPYGNGYPRHPDPAYADQTPYGSGYQRPMGSNPTERLNPYQQYGYDEYATGQYGPGYDQGFGQGIPSSEPPPPSGPRSPLWLWVLAAAVVLLVVALVIALVIANSSRQETVLAPAPSGQTGQDGITPSTTQVRPTTPSRTSTPAAPPPTSSPASPTAPTAGAPTGAMETVEYSVIGEGRVINITYTDTGGVPQTEFNVVLPWSKQVELPSPAESAARISIINVGRDVTCAVAIDGVKVEQSTGSGLTYCVGTG